MAIVSTLAAESPARSRSPSAHERPLSVAAAANLVYVLDALNTAFLHGEPQTKVTVAMGASGNLVAQIRHGAPYDVFLSADLAYPSSLIASGDAEAKSLITFATGRLVLWTTQPNVNFSSLTAALEDPAIRKLAMANPDTAPYGQAAKQALEHLGAWSKLKGKLVLGENITQTAQFVETGNADAGLVALSLVLSPKLKNRGRWIEVPNDAHAPLAQGAVMTRRGANNPVAQRYLDFLQSKTARKVFGEYGYAVTE